MNKMKEVAKLLGVELGEPFEIEGEYYNPFIIKEDGLYDRDNYKDDETFLGLILGKYKIKKQWKPKTYEVYYVPQIYYNEGYLYEIFIWNDSVFDKIMLRRNLVCKTEEEAIALAKKMLEVAKNE